MYNEQVGTKLEVKLVAASVSPRAAVTVESRSIHGRPARGHGPHRIVVRVDGSDSSKQALRWAVRQSEATGGVVEAVTAWDFPQFDGSLGWLPPTSGDEAALEARARGDLTETISEAVASQPSVEVRAEVRYGTPASVLPDAAHGASLLVVGSRGLGGFAGMLLGSVAQHCTQNAPCPVVVVRGDAQ
ncbi:universal stress protein [Streptomyces sp. NPDC091376]|uniref:universal stress protein n=1 Tax=Streptomyces sp. NPDC091376 TaxID=3365994 RepID=UPI0037F69417